MDMNTIKQQCKDIVEYMQENQAKQVKTILPHVIELATKQARGTGEGRELSFIRAFSDAVDENNQPIKGKVVAILDYYYKRWMALVGEDAVEFGVKNSSSTGFNTICKDGASLWTKQQTVAKKAEMAILHDLMAKTIDVEDIAGIKAGIEEKRLFVADTDLGFETKDEVIAYLEKEGIKLTADEDAQAVA